MKNAENSIRTTIKRIVSEAMEMNEMKIEGGEMEEQIRKYYELSQKFKNLKAEYDALEAEFKASEEPVRQMLENLDQAEEKVLELDDIMVSIKKSGYERESFKYKDISEWLYANVNVNMKALADEMMQNNRTLTYVQSSLKLKKKDDLFEGFVTDKIKSWFSKLASFFGRRADELQDDIQYFHSNIEGEKEPAHDEMSLGESASKSKRQIINEARRMKQLAGIKPLNENEDQEEDDRIHLEDVEERLKEGEIEVNGETLSDEEVDEFMAKYRKRIIELGREGYNPFDTVEMIEDEMGEED